jgi:hypothetical protein
MMVLVALAIATDLTKTIQAVCVYFVSMERVCKWIWFESAYHKNLVLCGHSSPI